MQFHFDLSAQGPTSTRKPDPLGLALVGTAGGDPHLLEGLRRLAWEHYLETGAPYGLSEEGMGTWWSERLEGAQG